LTVAVAVQKMKPKYKVLLKGFLLWTKIPSPDRLLYRFEIPWNSIDIKKLHNTLTGVSPKVKITSSRNTFKHRVQVLIFVKASRRLERVRDFHFANLYRYCIVIQKIGIQEFWRNLYLLPADNLKGFLDAFEEVKMRIQRINEIIKEETKNNRYNDLIRALRKLGLRSQAEELEELREKTLSGEGGWLLPDPVLRLEKLALRVEDITEMIEDPAVKRKVAKVLEEQYRSQLEEFFENIREQVKEAVKEAVRKKKREVIEHTRKYLEDISDKLEKLGLVALAETVKTVADRLNVRTKISEVEEILDSARLYI